MSDTIESVVEKVAAYVVASGHLDGLTTEVGYQWTLRNLAVATGVDPRLLGKVRLHFKRALAQALTPGKEPRFYVRASWLGRPAISIYARPGHEPIGGRRMDPDELEEIRRRGQG